MRKKNKLMLVAAVGMVAIVIASTAVRCSVAHTADESRGQDGEPAVEQAADPREDAPSGQEGGEGEADLEADILAVLQGNVWQAPGAPERTVTFRDGSFVESDGTSVTLAAFDVTGAGEVQGQRYLDVEIMRDGSPDATSSTIILDEAEGTLSVASDGFAAEKRYVQGKTSETPMEVTGVREPYTELIDGKTGELASSIADWCAAHAPSAARASFDGEVYLDVASGRVSATFHLDDAARSIVTAVYEAGAFSVLG